MSDWIDEWGGIIVGIIFIVLVISIGSITASYTTDEGKVRLEKIAMRECSIRGLSYNELSYYFDGDVYGFSCLKDLRGDGRDNIMFFKFTDEELKGTTSTMLRDWGDS